MSVLFVLCYDVKRNDYLYRHSNDFSSTVISATPHPLPVEAIFIIIITEWLRPQKLNAIHYYLNKEHINGVWPSFLTHLSFL